MASTPTRNSLPKRFRPLYDQALSEADLRYGAQQAGLASVLGSLTHDYGQQAQAQHDAGQSVLGALKGADSNLQQVYSQSGLTPQLLAQIGDSPTGQRLAGELAQGRQDLQGQLLGAQAGQQYQQQHIADQYQQDTGKVRDQMDAMLHERGVYTSGLLDQLISSDRSSRHDANLAAAKQAHDDAQVAAQIQAGQDNALIGQGLLPDSHGNLQPLPGGKADPNAPANQPKSPKASKPTGADRTAQADFRKAATWISQLDASVAKDHKDGTGQVDPTTGVKDGTGQVIKGVTDPAKRRQVVQEILLKGDRVSGIPSISGVGLDAALDTYYNKALSPETVTALHNAGVKVKFLGNGVITANQNSYEQRIKRNEVAGPPAPKNPTSTTTTTSTGTGGGNPHASGKTSTGNMPTLGQILANPQHYTPAQVAAARSLKGQGALPTLPIDKHGRAG